MHLLVLLGPLQYLKQKMESRSHLTVWKETFYNRRREIKEIIIPNIIIRLKQVLYSFLSLQKFLEFPAKLYLQLKSVWFFFKLTKTEPICCGNVFTTKT